MIHLVVLLNCPAQCLPFISFRKDAVLRKLGDRPEIQNYEYLAKLRNLYIEKEHTEETDPTATLTIYEAFSELNINIEKK